MTWGAPEPFAWAPCFCWIVTVVLLPLPLAEEDTAALFAPTGYGLAKEPSPGTTSCCLPLLPGLDAVCTTCSQFMGKPKAFSCAMVCALIWF